MCQKLGHTKSQCFKVKNTHQLEDYNVFGSSSVEDKTQVLRVARGEMSHFFSFQPGSLRLSMHGKS